MRENRKSGSMSGPEKPSHGWDIEALPEETGSQRIGQPTATALGLDSTRLTVAIWSGNPATPS